MEFLAGCLCGAFAAGACFLAHLALTLARKGVQAGEDAFKRELALAAKEKRLDERLGALELEVNRVRQNAGVAPRKAGG